MVPYTLQQSGVWLWLASWGPELGHGTIFLLLFQGSCWVLCLVTTSILPGRNHLLSKFLLCKEPFYMYKMIRCNLMTPRISTSREPVLMGSPILGKFTGISNSTCPILIHEPNPNCSPLAFPFPVNDITMYPDAFIRKLESSFLPLSYCSLFTPGLPSGLDYSIF